MNKKLNLFLCCMLALDANIISALPISSKSNVDLTDLQSDLEHIVSSNYYKKIPGASYLSSIYNNPSEVKKTKPTDLAKNIKNALNETKSNTDGQSLLELASGLYDYNYGPDHHGDIRFVNGDLTGIQILIGLGADPNIQDVNGTTPLMEAALTAQEDIVDYLLSNGAKADIINKHNRKAYDYADLSQKDPRYQSTSLQTKLQNIKDLLTGKKKPTSLTNGGDDKTGTKKGQSTPKDGQPKKDEGSTDTSGGSSSSISSDDMAGIVVAGILSGISAVLIYKWEKNRGGKLSAIEIEALSKMPLTNAQEVVDFVKTIQILTGDQSETVSNFFKKIQNKTLRDFLSPEDIKALPEGLYLSIQEMISSSLPREVNIREFAQQLPILMEKTYVKNLTPQEKAEFLLNKLFTEDFLISYGSDKGAIIDVVYSISQKTDIEFEDAFKLFLNITPIANSPAREDLIKAFNNAFEIFRRVATVSKTRPMNFDEMQRFTTKLPTQETEIKGYRTPVSEMPKVVKPLEPVIRPPVTREITIRPVEV